MAVTLGNLIDDVEAKAGSQVPIVQLATAASTVVELNDLTDSLLSHFVDKARRNGHSWAEIGEALGVTRQAVQKRFTADPGQPRGFEQFTDKARLVVFTHAQAASLELKNNYVGTEHLLLAFYAEDCLARTALKNKKVKRDELVAAMSAMGLTDVTGQGGYTPRAWSAIEGCLKIALELGTNYIGTEHLLISLLSGVGGVAETLLLERGVTRDETVAFVKKKLGL